MQRPQPFFPDNFPRLRLKCNVITLQCNPDVEPRTEGGRTDIRRAAMQLAKIGLLHSHHSLGPVVLRQDGLVSIALHADGAAVDSMAFVLDNSP